MAQTVKITPASGLLEFIGNTTSNKPYLQHDDNGNLTLTLQATKKFTVAGNLKVNGKVTMAQQTLTDGAAITWDFNSGANAKVTIAGARTLVISNMETGDTGLILVKQDAAGGRTLSLPSGSSIVGGGTYTASSAANATDVLGVYYDGTTYWWTIGYNTVTPPLTSVGITGSDFTISNSPLTSNGTIGLALATVNSNVGSFGSASAVPVITVNAKGLITAVSTTNISIPTNLDSLTDVTISSATTGQLLQFNGSQWVNWTPNYLTGITSAQVTTALGYTPVPTTRTLSINGTSYDLSANRAWTIDTVSYVSRVQHGVKAGVAINKGQAVYVTSANGTNMIVGLASNTSEATSSKTMGLLDATVAINGMANVVTEGLLTNIDTSLAGTEGDPVWLGANGNLIFGLANKPYAPNHLVFIGIVTRKNANTGEIFVKVQNGFELREIHDVDLITTVPVNGEILGYNGTLWVNKTIAGWLGFTPANDANVVHTSGNETIAGIKTFSGTTQATSTTTGTIVTSGGVGIAKNLYVGGDINVVGNLIIGGTTTTVYAQNLSVSDNMIYLNNGVLTTITNAVGNGSTVVYTTAETHNYIAGMSVTITGITPSAYNLSNQTITAVGTNSFTIANSATGSYSTGGTARAKTNANPDLGFAAGYNDGSYAHAGLFRDATDNVWKFFKGYTPEPDASPFIDTSHASFVYADLRANDITGRSFIKDGGTSSQFLKADGSVDSSTYLTTGTASSTYQPLDADLTAIAALATTGFLKRTGSNTWSLDSNTYLTSYTETDTLATVTSRGATTATATSFTGGAAISSLTLNGATAIAESSLKLGAHGTDEGGQLSLEKATSYTYAAHIDVWRDNFRILTGTNSVSSAVGLQIDLGTKQLVLPSYTTSSSFSGTAVGWLAFDASGKVITVPAPTGAVTSVNAGTGVSVNSTTGAVTVSIGQSVATSATPSFDKVFLTNNGNGTNLKVGDDAWIGDVNRANTIGIVGQQDSTAGYISFGITDTATLLGRTGTGALTWGGNTIYHAGNLTNLNQLTNGPGYITGYTETDTLASVTGRGATTATDSVFTGGLRGRKDQTDGNYTTAALWTESYNNTTTGIAFHISGNVGKFLEMRTDGRLYWDNGTVYHSGNLTNLNQLTNGPGYITGITSANVTTALGYTPVPTTRTLTINGTAYDLSANRSWTITAGVSSVSAGSGISVNTTTGAVTVTNTGLLSATAGSGISVSTVSGALTVTNTGLLSATAGSGIGVSTVSGALTVTNTGLLSAVAGSGISVSTVSGALTVTNTGLLSATAGSGISVSTVNGALNITNTGLLSAAAGSGISVSTVNGALTITNTISQPTLSLSGSTLSISGGNSVTLPSGGISQGTADSLYVNVSGDVMTGSLYIFPISDNPAQFQLAGTNPELYVSAKTGTARVFIDRQASGNQATLMFTTGMATYQGTAWDYSGAPMWSMGMTNNNNTDSFKLGYGDIYDPLSVALEITSAQVAYFKYVPYAAGNLLATQSWVQSQGYLTSVSDVWVNTSGDTMTGALTINTTGSAGNAALRINNSTSSTFVHTQENLAANLTAGQHNILVVGKAGNTKNSGYIGYYWAANASDSNFVTIGHWGNDDLLRVYGNGTVTIGTNTVWHAGNDGAGSGLDADLLDGYHATTLATANTVAVRDSSGNLYVNYVLGSYFNASAGNSENPTIGQIWTQNTSDNYLRKSTPGHFRSQVIDGYYLPLSGGIITGTLDLSNNTLQGVGHIIMSDSGFGEGIQWESWFICDSPNDNSNQTGNLQFVYVPDNSVRMTFDTGGTLTLSNRLIELSSIRYKTRVESLTPALDKIMQLRPVTYYRIGVEDTKEIGLIAEEVAEIYPELIKYNDNGQVDGINYTRIAPILIKTIQEQQELIKKLTERIENLENR